MPGETFEGHGKSIEDAKELHGFCGFCGEITGMVVLKSSGGPDHSLQIVGCLKCGRVQKGENLETIKR